MAAMHLNDNTFRQLLAGEKPVLVEFCAPWCGHCVNLEAAFDEIADEYADRLAIGKINITSSPHWPSSISLSSSLRWCFSPKAT